ncbi:hypothetical protein QTP88_025013 [Uroleucon formosanum]
MGPKLSPLIISKVRTPVQSIDKSPLTCTNNEPDWKIVHHNHNRSPQPNSPPTKKTNSNIFFASKNRYAPLSPTSAIENENETQRMEISSEQPTVINNDTNTTKINLPPPIFIEANLNFNTLCLKLKELTDTSSFVYKSTTKGVKIQTFSSDSYRSVIKFLKEKDVSFHSYQSKENKPFRIVIESESTPDYQLTMKFKLAFRKAATSPHFSTFFTLLISQLVSSLSLELTPMTQPYLPQVLTLSLPAIKSKLT